MRNILLVVCLLSTCLTSSFAQTLDVGADTSAAAKPKSKSSLADKPLNELIRCRLAVTNLEDKIMAGTFYLDMNVHGYLNFKMEPKVTGEHEAIVAWVQKHKSYKTYLSMVFYTQGDVAGGGDSLLAISGFPIPPKDKPVVLKIRSATLNKFYITQCFLKND